jgi:hypothetical protein
MPGGFIGYGVRPFDRLTAMGVDYRGGMWKVRGRVAEEFDPANRTLQRRPLGQSPRSDCESCHVVLSGWPLTPDAPTTSDVCRPPTAFHGGGDHGASLIHAETVCEKCHNPNRQPPAALFPNGWLTCVKGTLLPRSSPVPPPEVTTACSIPVGHVFTPPGTVCTSCHNSVIARPLNDPVLACAQRQSTTLPTIRTTATISGALNDANAPIAAGSSTTDTTPALRGSLSAALQSGQAVRVLRSGTAIGLAAVSGTAWSFTDPGAGNGRHAYTARVEAGGAFGPTSNSYAITIDTAAPTQTTSVLISDDINPGTLPNPGFTTDTTPSVSGVLSAALASGETVRVLRGGVTVASVDASGTGWRYTEAAALGAATYTYSARVVDAAGNLGPLSASATVTIVAGLPTATITRAVSDLTESDIPANSFTRDNTPTLQGTLSAALGVGQVVRVRRDGVPFTGSASVSATSWTFTDTGAGNGAHTYTARTEQGTLFSASSAGYTFTIDTVAPTQSADVTQISDDISGVLADGASSSDTTPAVAGTLSAPLGASESLQVLRNGAPASTFRPATTAWTYTEASPLAPGSYVYAARVVDAADNVSPAVGRSRSVVVSTAFPLAGATTTLSTINGVAPSGGSVPINNINAPVLAGTIQRPLGAATGEVVRVYRNGAVAGTATVSGTNWGFTSVILPDGSHTFLARIEQAGNPSVFGQPSASVKDPIDATRPAQTVKVTAISNVPPFTRVPGAFPPDESILGQTNDPTPTVTIQLSGPLASDEALVIRRGNSEIKPALVSCGTNCLRFTDDQSVRITVPLDPPSPLPLPNAYSAHVVDTAGNQGAGETLKANFDYFNCDQVRADFSLGGKHQDVSSITNPKGRCENCHRTSPVTEGDGGTPRATHVAVPFTKPSYWCRRP